MAFTPNQFLYSPSNVTLKDYAHAARIFTDDQFRLAPKSKFLFHVAFSINQSALKNIDLVQRYRNEINVLVKSCDLPQFKVTVDTLNQYNRKKNIQSTHKYEALNIVFHDDNMSLINQLWQNYYSYYYADSKSALDPSAYKRNATRNSNFITNPYGLDNGSTAPFFNYITIYQMARHEYVSYTLLNPVISSFNHNKLDYAQSTTPHDFSMSIAYEAVAYGNGTVTVGDPEGFAFEHYDQTPSSLQPGDGSRQESPSFIGNSSLNAQEIANTVSSQLNTYLNTKENQNSGSNKILTTVQSQQTGGLQGFSFPQVNVNAQQNNNTVVAKQVNLNITNG
jgi:hypothetical protein